MQSLNRFMEVEVDFFNYHAVDLVETILNVQQPLSDKISLLEKKLLFICNQYPPNIQP